MIYSLGFGRLTALLSVRYDIINNELYNKLLPLNSAFSNKQFTHLSYRVGISYNLRPMLTIYSDISTGFIPPSTEELANNPFSYSGFNTHLVPSTSITYETGIKGADCNLNYELTGFVMHTGNDFFRFKLHGRGNQEVFYGNAGNSLRRGLEVYVSYKPTDYIRISSAYTFSNFKYVSASLDPIFSDTSIVLTHPPHAGQYLPNSPEHVLFTQLSVRPLRNTWVSIQDDYRSPWVIYTDWQIYQGLLNPSIYKPWYHGYNLVNMEISYTRKISNMRIETNFALNNLLNSHYIAFTEPDPDGNSYHPGPGREVFFSIKIIY